MRRMYSKPQLLEAVESESKLNGIKVFEDIKDKDGHARFIEGDIELNTDGANMFTLSYGKWSLSGSHLMFVLACEVASGVSITGRAITKPIVLPQWVMNKIIPVKASTLEYKSATMYDSSLNSQLCQFRLVKTDEGMLFYTATAITLTADRGFRIAFDLLIDNE